MNAEQGIRVSPKIRILPSGTLSQSGLRKFCFGIPIIETCYRRGGRSERDKLDRRRSTKSQITLDGRDPGLRQSPRTLVGSGRVRSCREFGTRLTIPPSSDGRPLVYRSDRQARSTARCRRAGPLATAGTCYRSASS